MGKNKGFLISISVTAPTLVTASANVILGDKKTISRSRGAAEAVLFGHLADAISNPVVSEIIKKHENLVAFTRNVLEEYFLIPMRSPKANLRLSLWEVNMDIFLIAYAVPHISPFSYNAGCHSKYSIKFFFPGHAS